VTTMNNLEWTKAEKHVARRAYDLAYERECRSIRAKVEQMLKADNDIRQIWRIHDYLSKERRETDRKYDYRYSVLIYVFARLIGEGWITEADLSGLGKDKTQRIKAILALEREDEVNS
jgi:hypothetical protein